MSKHRSKAGRQAAPTAAQLAASIDPAQYGVSAAQVEIMARVRTGTTILNDVLEAHGEYADAVIAALLNGGTLGQQFPDELQATLMGLMKVAFAWGVRSQEEHWPQRYRSGAPSMNEHQEPQPPV